MNTENLYVFEGSLYDRRKDDKPLRPVFESHFREIENTQQLKATLRAGPSTWPGCYPLYFLTSDGEAMSFDSVRKNLRFVLSAIKDKDNSGWRVIGCDVNYEDGELICADSGERIKSAYAEPEDN